MICEGCGANASHIFSDDRGEHCEHCSNVSIVSKTKTDGILARTSWRVRRQQSRHEGDMVLPHVYDKTARRQRVNPDFLKLYPNQVKEFFSEDELKRDGYSEMPKHIAKNTERHEIAKAKAKMDTMFSGSSKKAIEKFLTETNPA
jgi:hypothetical protein